MRINHLLDSEIQAYLDRRRVVGSDVTYRDEVNEHLESCVLCRQELLAYEQLFGELSEAPEMTLPKNFAKKVTLSLPPLAAARTRARIQTSLAGLAAVLTVLAVLSALNWKLLVTAAATSLTTGYVTAVTWFELILSMVPVPDFSALRALIDLTTVELIEELLFSSHGATDLLLLAALGILLVASLDGIMPIRPQRQSAR